MNNARLKRSLLAAMGLVALILGVAATASAFTFQQIGGFTLGTESSSDGPGTGILFFNPIGTPPNTYGTIGWGNHVGASAVTVDDPFLQDSSDPTLARSALRFDTVSGIINPGDTVVISHLTHANRLILSPTLEGVIIANQLTIFDGATPVLVPPAPGSLGNLPIALTETLNVGPADGSGCDAATHISTTTPCSDFFLFPLPSTADVPFTYLGVDYSLTFGLVPGPGTIFEIVPCNGGTCGRVRTAESSTNEIDITMRLNQLTTDPALQVAKSSGSFLPGGQAVFTIVVTNLSTSTDLNVVLTDQLPGNGGLVWETASTGAGTCDPIVDNLLTCHLGNISGGGSVTITVSSTATTPLAACQSQPNPEAVATSDNAPEAVGSGTLTCTPPQSIRTVTQGGWGAPPRGRNPGALLMANFSQIGPVVIGSSAAGCHALTFTSAQAIQSFLPQGGTPKALTASAIDPTGKITVFAGQVLALEINVAFSNVGVLPPGLAGFIVPSGPAAGRTVAQVLTDANTALGCGTLPVYVTSISQLSDLITSFNEMFD